MRPSILFPLFAETHTLAGVGPKLEKLIDRVAGPRLVDLIFDLPVGLIDRSYTPRLIEEIKGIRYVEEMSFHFDEVALLTEFTKKIRRNLDIFYYNTTKLHKHPKTINPFFP